MSLKIHYSRDWNEGGLRSFKVEVMPLNKLQHQRLGRLVLPFLALYKMPQFFISYGLSALNIYEEYGTIKKWNTDLLKDRAFLSLAQSTAEIGSVLIGGLRLGLIVNTAGDLIQETLSFQDPSKRTLLSIAKFKSKALYLTSLIYQSSTKLQTASLVLEGCVNLYQTYLIRRDIEKRKTVKPIHKELDLIASLTLGILRFCQAYDLNFVNKNHLSTSATVIINTNL